MKKGIIQNNEGISPVLGFILMLAVGVTILTTVQLSFVPVWNTEEELSHLKIMQDDFNVLKSNIESGILGGTTLSSPLIMGFKYSPKILVYNPREEAYASLQVRNNTWVEVRYNEVFPEGMTDDTSIKNVSTGMMVYALQGARNYNSFIYENGLIRRSGSNFTSSSQTLLANNTIFLPSVRALEYNTLSGVEKKTINIYPTSQQKNSVIGENVWLILHTSPEYVEWWGKTLADQGMDVKKKDNTTGVVIAYTGTSTVIKMGEAYIAASSRASPPHAPPERIVRISGQKIVLPVDGITNLVVEVQDRYNNPVPNVPVSFQINQTRPPGNSYANAAPLQSSAVSGTDGRASFMLQTSGAGFFYIDASLADYDYTTTFTYSASSQGNVLLLDPVPSWDDYLVTATLKNSLGGLESGRTITFDTSDGFVTPVTNNTTVSGIAGTRLNISNATGIKITNILATNIVRDSADISWDTINDITVTAKTGYVFNSVDITTSVDTNGCVFFGTSPGKYSRYTCDIIDSSHSVTLNNISWGTAYYYIVNTSRPGGTSVNSTEYMFVTEGTSDIIPPASITNLTNVTYEPLFIRWTWTDPTDIDFDHVDVRIDGIPAGTVDKGIQSFNATYLMPNSTHTISIRTVDSSFNPNATWVSHNAFTPSLISYVYGYTIGNGLGTVTGWSNAQTSSDGGAWALLNETITPAVPARNNYTYVTSYSATNGTISSFAYMQNATGFANLIEGGTSIGGGTSNNITNSNFNTFNTGWYYSESDPRGYMTGSYDGAVGNTASGGTGPGSESFIYRDTSGSRPTAGTQDYARILSTSFTAPANITAISSKFAMDVSGSTFYNARYTVTYNIINNSTGTKVAEVYNSASKNTNSPWASYTNNSIPASILIPGNSYNVQIELRIDVDTANRPNIYFHTDDIYFNITTSGVTNYNMNITTDTASVPVDTNYYLEINYSRNANETYNVSIYNTTTWNVNRGSLNAAAGTWALLNVSLKSGEYNSGNPRIRYIDIDPSGTSRGNLSIDYQRIHGYTAGILAGYHLDVTTNTEDVPDAVTQTLQLRYNVSAAGDNFTLQVYNGTDWDIRATLNQTSMTLLTIPLQIEDLQSNGTFSPSTVSDLNRYYVQVRYLDESELKMGRLYLDYQRVYSS